jgi:alcohol dehydrogenase class IV
VSGAQHARTSGLLLRVEGLLRGAGVDVVHLEGVEPNPTDTAIDAGALLAKTARCDLVVALGGGSVIDAAKAISVAASDPDSRPYRNHLSGIRTADVVHSVLPVVALPTLPGSASETNGTSVITDAQTGRKLSAHCELATPRLAIIDPQLASEAPTELLASGFIDALCHALEAGLSVRANAISDASAEAATRILLRDTPMAVDSTQIDHVVALESAWWASNLAGQALTIAGSIVTHPLAHALTARLDVRHGDAVAALEPAVLAGLAQRLADAPHLDRVAGWMDVRTRRTSDDALRGILRRLSQLCKSLDVRESICDLGAEQHHFAQLVRDTRESGSRGLHNLPGSEPAPDELFAILDLAAQHGPGAQPKALLDAARRAHEEADPRREHQGSVNSY